MKATAYLVKQIVEQAVEPPNDEDVAARSDASVKRKLTVRGVT